MASSSESDSSLLQASHALGERLPPAGRILLAYSLDGACELLEWTRAGVGADPSACFWLATLRMARRLGFQLKTSLPPLLPRPLDALELDASRWGPEFSRLFPRMTMALTCERMGTPAHPLSRADLPEEFFALSWDSEHSAYLRALPMAAVTYLREDERRSLILDNAAIDIPSGEERSLLADAFESVEPCTEPGGLVSLLPQGLGMVQQPVQKDQSMRLLHQALCNFAPLSGLTTPPTPATSL